VLGVVGYDNFNGASCQMHVAGVGNWVTRDFLFAAFDYPFNECNLECVLGTLPSSREDGINFSFHIGFKPLFNIPRAHPDGELMVMVMYKEECPWIKGAENGDGRRRELISSS